MFAEEIKKSLVRVIRDFGVFGEIKISLEHPSDLAHGDYSTNVAMELAKKQNKNPKELAEEIVSKWKDVGLPDFVEKVEAAGAGFINIWLKFTALSRQLTEVLKNGDGFGRSDGGKGKTMVVDYSSPNIAKPFGIGHLRSTNLGQAIYNLSKFCGWKVIGDNHLGDWGTQFGRLICQIEIKNQKSKIKNKELTIEDLERLYVEFHKDLETKPELEEEARMWFKKLEEGDSEAKEIWQACVDISLKEFNRIYDLLGVKIDVTLGESFYQDKMDEVLEDCRNKGLLKESEGALVVELPGMEVPAMLVKSDGATTYLLRDLAAVKFRIRKWNPDLIVYEVGADQSLHFQQLFKICELLGYGQLNQFVHVSHGLIRWPTGKFSTRTGETIHLEKVLNEAIERAKKIANKGVNNGVAIDPAIAGQNATGRGEKIAQAVGIGAIKYNDLKQNSKTDIIFDWEQILTLSGNSGPYLQYTYARTQSVISRSNIKYQISKTQPKTQNELNKITIQQYNNEEIALLRTLYKFPEVVGEAARTYSPNLVCNFLFDLAQKFNLFYDKHRILVDSSQQLVGRRLTEEQSHFRLALTIAVGQILKNGLTLLGIEPLERM